MIVLLGAGASVDAGIPTARGMTSVMLRTVGERPESTKVQHAVRLAVASVVFGQGVRNDDLTHEVNIEDVFNLLDTLSERHRLEASPLIGAWHPVVEKLDRLTVGGRPNRAAGSGMVASFNSREDARKIADAIEEMIRSRSSHGTSQLAQALEHVLNPRSAFRSVPTPPEPKREISGQGEIFEKAKQFLYAELRNHVFVGADRDLSYLDPLVAAAERERITIGTLNYDNCVELVAARLGVALDTGLEAWRDKGEIGFGRFDAVPFRKLHGSITWARAMEEASERHPLPREIINEATARDLERPDYEPAIIFGGRNKLTVEGPFLDLLRDFRDRLNAARKLVVIGYSFADAHVNALVTQWLNKVEDATITIVNGRDFAGEARGFARRLLNIPGDRVTNFEKGATEGIAELFGAVKPTAS